MVPIGGGSTKFVLSDRWIVYTKSRKQLLHRKYPLYETGCRLGSDFQDLDPPPSLVFTWNFFWVI